MRPFRGGGAPQLSSEWRRREKEVDGKEGEGEGPWYRRVMRSLKMREKAKQRHTVLWLYQ